MSDPQLRLDADMGDGDDRLQMLDAAGGAWVGGPGRDRLGGPRCQVADVRLGDHFDCEDEVARDVDYSAIVDAWETVSAPGGRITVIGTDGPDTIHAFGRTTSVDGRGGRDVLTTSGDRTRKATSRPTVVRGGAGSDRIRGGYSNERLVGGSGDDVIVGGPGEDLIIGGGGNDRMSGGRHADRLDGGAGRDRADGGPGRDSCSAEVRRSCERR